MGLQLRMTHSLGQRLVEVEARKADQAIVVGRASNAEVQIPSANISKRHCLLFVHEGRWVVQDADSPTGTFLNGERLTEPAFVNSGDVISLGRGSNPPTLTVDPHSVGVTEEQEESPAARVPAAAQVQAPPPQWSAPSAPPGGHVMPPPLMPPQQAPRGFVHEDEKDNIFGAPAAAAAPFYGPPGSYSPPGSVPGYGMPAAPPADEWGSVSEPAKPRRRSAKPQGTSGTTIAITAVVAMVIVIGGGMIIYNNYQKSKQVEIIKAPAPTAGSTQTNKPHSIFEEGPSRPRPEKSGAADRTPPAVANTADAAHVARAGPAVKPATTAAAPEMEPVVDKRRDDPEWDAIESARSQDDPPIAIAKFQDYLNRFPDSPNKKDIEKYTNEELDNLWWSHLAELFAQRDEAQKEITSRKLDISQSQDAEFKKGLEKEIAKFTETRDGIESTIRDQMKFTGQTAPNPYSAEDKAIARKTRDEEYYEKTWKPAVLRAIQNSHGQRLPWRSAR